MNSEQKFSVAVGRTEITTFQATSPALHTPKWACGLVHLVWGVVTLCAGVLAARLFSFRTLGKEIVPEKLVKCPCQNCSGKIEFDANAFTLAGNWLVECPHCKLETRLFIPVELPDPKPKKEKIKEIKNATSGFFERFGKGRFDLFRTTKFERFIFETIRIFASVWAVMLMLSLLVLTVNYFRALYATFYPKTDTSEAATSITAQMIGTNSDTGQDFGIFFGVACVVMTMLTVVGSVLVLLSIERNTRKKDEKGTCQP